MTHYCCCSPRTCWCLCCPCQHMLTHLCSGLTSFSLMQFSAKTTKLLYFGVRSPQPEVSNWDGKSEKASTNCRRFWGEAGSLPCTVLLGRGLAELPVSQFAPSPFLGRCRTGRTCHLCTPRAVNPCLAPSPVAGFGTASTQDKGQFQGKLRRCLSCSLAVCCSGFGCFGHSLLGFHSVNGCSLWSLVRCMFLGVQGRRAQADPFLGNIWSVHVQFQ